MKTRALSMLLIGGLTVTGCATSSTTAKGAGWGTAVGAGAGALVGSLSGRPAEGALIGGAVGAATGAVVGNEVGEKRRRQAGQREVVQTGHYETRIVRQPNGETYEERVWVPDRR